jgi:hypothetical protein
MARSALGAQLEMASSLPPMMTQVWSSGWLALVNVGI